MAGEELGFVGCAAILLLLLFIIFECIRISLRAKDLSGKLICCGMGALVGIQSFINIAVVTNIMPNTGTPLPFVSYGLTSMVSLYIGMGLVLNVGLQRYKKYRELMSHEHRINRTQSKKKLMQNFCIAYRNILSKNTLYATGTTGRLIEEASNLTVHKFLAGHLGGEQQLGALIEQNEMDLVIYAPGASGASEA